MGGVVKPVAKMVGMVKETATAGAVEKVKDVLDTKESKASRMDEEQGARMRGSRRRGRQLLSDARLSAEAGGETLGSGQTL